MDDIRMTPRGNDLPSDALGRGSGIAAWRQIADRLEAEIARDGLKAGARLPTESELAQRFRVNRHTVRRALAALAAEGVVRAARGSGTFVEGRRINYPIGARTRFTEIMAAEGHVAGGELLDWTTLDASEAVAGMLDVPPGAPVLRVRIMRFGDGLPLALGVNYLPLPRLGGFVAAFEELGAVTPALAACGVADYRRRETRVSAREATGEEALRLALGSGRVVLAVNAVNEDEEGRAVLATEAVFPAERIELIVPGGA